jgi:predicted nucleotidyltransferase
MEVDEAVLREVVRRVLQAAQPDKIILFGSAASGTMTKDSDLDLLVVEPEPADTRQRSVDIRRAVGNVPYPIDVIVVSSRRFRETKDLIGAIAYPAHKYGRVLYETA